MGNGGWWLPVLVRQALEHKIKRGKTKGRVRSLGKGSNSPTAAVSKLGEILLSVSKATRVSIVAARRKRGVE